jgi:hypothetical protein
VQAGGRGLGRAEGEVAAQVLVGYLADARVAVGGRRRRRRRGGGGSRRAARRGASRTSLRGDVERERRHDERERKQDWRGEFPFYEANHLQSC